jgi:thiol:disulfide interchange protein DsbA
MFKRLIASAVLSALSLLSATAAAQGPVKWIEGIHYFRLQPAQPTSTPGKVEVLDVFSYACPACNAFEPTFDKLKAALPAGAQIAYLPAAFNPQEDWPVFQRAFLAAENLGVVEKTHDAMYDAVWGKNTLAIIDANHHLLPQAQQPTIDDVAKFYAGYGIKPADFVAMANSFTIASKIRGADAQLLAEQVDSTPTIIVNGKYRVTPRSAGGYQQVIDVVLYLIQREQGGG